MLASSAAKPKVLELEATPQTSKSKVQVAKSHVKKMQGGSKTAMRPGRNSNLKERMSKVLSLKADSPSSN